MGLDEKHAILDALMTAVDEETALEIIDYRKRMGKRFHLTPRAAGMLAKNLAACPNPVAAADEMMLRGWTAVKPEWIARSAGQEKPRGVFGAAYDLLENGYGHSRESAPAPFELTAPIQRH